MNSILIKGISSSGKSSTMRAICKKLNPDKVYRLIPDKNNYANSSIKDAEVEDIFNNTFIIEVKGKLILVCAGAPTEQSISITVLIDICIKIKIDISFLMVSMRSFERTEGFDTPKELAARSNIVLTEEIHRINSDNFEDTVEWKNRISRFSEVIFENL